MFLFLTVKYSYMKMSQQLLVSVSIHHIEMCFTLKSQLLMTCVFCRVPSFYKIIAFLNLVSLISASSSQRSLQAQMKFVIRRLGSSVLVRQVPLLLRKRFRVRSFWSADRYRHSFSWTSLCLVSKCRDSSLKLATTDAFNFFLYC